MTISFLFVSDRNDHEKSICHWSSVICHLKSRMIQTAEKIGIGIAIAIEVVGLQKPIAIPMPTLFMCLGARPRA